MRNITTIFFDLGSTLLYFDGDWQEVMPRAIQALYNNLHSLGIYIDPHDFEQSFWRRLNKYYVQRELEYIEYTTTSLLENQLCEFGYEDINPEKLQQAVDAMYAVTQTHWLPENEVHSTLNELSNRGYQMAIISNAGDDRDVQALVDKAGIRDYFKIILSSASIGIRKPNPEIFNAVINKLGIEPVNAAMVGDTLSADILGAHNSGLIDIWITRRGKTTANIENLEYINPTLIVNNLAELPDLFAWLNHSR